MKKFFSIFSLLVAFSISSISSIWATTATETIEMKGFGGLSTNSYQNITVEGTSNESNIKMIAYAFNPFTGQVRGSKTSVAGGVVKNADNTKNWSLYNSEAIPGTIKSVKVTQTATGNNKFQNNLHIALGTELQSEVTIGTQKQDAGGTATEINFTIDETKKYTYFKLLSTEKFTSGSVAGVKVEISYETSGSTPEPTPFREPLYAV